MRGTMRTISRRLARLEDQLVTADRKVRSRYRLVLCRFGSRTSLENATCKRTLCPDGTVVEFVELDGSNDGPGSVTAEELDRWVDRFPIEVSGMGRAR